MICDEKSVIESCAWPPWIAQQTGELLNAVKQRGCADYLLSINSRLSTLDFHSRFCTLDFALSILHSRLSTLDFALSTFHSRFPLSTFHSRLSTPDFPLSTFHSRLSTLDFHSSIFIHFLNLLRILLHDLLATRFVGSGE